MKTKFFLYILLPLFIFFVAGEAWVRYKFPVVNGHDRIIHPYIVMGGFHKGGYFKKDIAADESPEAFGYEDRTWLGIPSFKFGTPVKSIAERGRFLFRERAGLVTDEKPKDQIRVFILGGSVSFGEGASVPANRWFIHLERILKEKTGKNILVIPAANHSHVTTQERIIYDLFVSPNKPDVAIFLNGFNDANTGAAATRPGDPFAQGTLYLRDRSPLYGFLNDIGKHSMLVQYFLEQTFRTAWKEPVTPSKLESQAQSVASVYLDNLSQLQRRCLNEKVKCFFYLQPYRNQTLRNRNQNIKTRVDEQMDANYSRIKTELKNYPFVTDFTGVFDDSPKEDPFSDQAHFNDEAHLVLAQKMAEHLLENRF